MVVAPQVACPACGRRVDPLRAGHVAVLNGRFEYFCGLPCKRRYLRDRRSSGGEDVPTAAPPEVVGDGEPMGIAEAALGAQGEVRAAATALGPSGRPPAAPVRADRPVRQPPVRPAHPPAPARAADRAMVHAGAAKRTRTGGRLLLATDAAGILFGVLAPALGLAGLGAPELRLALVVGAWALLVARVVRAGRDAADPHPLTIVGPVAGAVVASGWAEVAGDPHAAGIVALAGIGAAAAIVVERATARARARVEVARRRVERALPLAVRAIDDGQILERAAGEIRAGEQIVVQAGEIVGVDGVVAAGEACVVPWLGATEESVRREGDPIVAGARVATSRLRVTTTWSGHDRAWVKLLSVPATRVDVTAPALRALRLAVERGGPAAAAIAGVSAFAENATAVEVLASICAAAMALGGKALCSFAAVRYAKAHLQALAHGIAYKDARSFERAGAIDVAVLSARGTVLLGEPEIVAVEATGPRAPVDAAGPEGPDGSGDVARVLALAAGAEAASTHPFAAAMLHAARARGVRIDPVRNATVRAGLGVTALASSGERLVVGGRGIMLEEKIGVALSDARVSALEAQGFSVVFVALSERVVGLIALKDVLRPGARAAVQRLLDAEIEPVLVSGEARETCETLGRALDIDHVRPEVLPADRGGEVRGLAEGGARVAVIGHPAIDDGAMGAADVAVAMGAAGSAPGEWAVALASDDVRDAARALAIPRATRKETRVSVVLGSVPAIGALLAIGFGIAPFALAPLAPLLGAAAIALHARGLDRTLDP